MTPPTVELAQRVGRPWLTTEQFAYTLLDAGWARLHLLARLNPSGTPPSRAHLVAWRGQLATLYGPREDVGARRRPLIRLTVADTPLLWRATFEVPLHVIEYPGVHFVLAGDRHVGIALPAPVLGEVRAVRHTSRPSPHALVRMAGRHAVALAAGVAVATCVSAGTIASADTTPSGPAAGPSTTTGVTTATTSTATDPGSTATGTTSTGTAPTTTDPGSTATDPGSTATDPGSTATDPGSTATDPEGTATGTTSTGTTPTPPDTTPTPPDTTPTPPTTTPTTTPPPPVTTPTTGTPSPTTGTPAPTTTGTTPTTTPAARTPSTPHHSKPHAQRPASSRRHRRARLEPRHADTAPRKQASGSARSHRTVKPHVRTKAPEERREPQEVSVATPQSILTAAGDPLTIDPFTAAQIAHFEAIGASLDQPPRFLIPIYKAAARRYRLPWQILAAINAIETDYGRNLSVSVAGAVGWMQFEPSTWFQYGLSADGSGRPNPYDPKDAIFSAARYLAANGAPQHMRQALFAYNHALWYVDAVLWRSALIGDARTAAMGRRSGYALPLDARYMQTLGRTDDGVDVEAAPDGAAVYSITPGIVTAVASDPGGFGPNYPVVLATAGPLTGQYIYYGHVGASLVTVGQRVLAGQPIAVMGHTGDAASLGHGHIEIGFSDGSGDPLNHHGTTAWTPSGDAMRHVLEALFVAQHT